MVAVSARTGFTVDAIDGFCGVGGSSQGILAAGATLRVAFNHNELNIETHAENFPDVDHWLADVSDHKNPEHVDRKGKKVPGRYVDPAELPAARFAWFSPGCQHHTLANATKIYAQGRQALLFGDGEEFDEQAYARSERSRMTMACVLRYASRNRPEIIVTENVVEVCQWGPGKDGSTFRWWLGELTKLGYEYQCCFFNSQFFPPCPQSRDRVYIVAWRKGNKRPDLDYRPVACCISQKCAGRLVNAVQTWKPRTKAWPLPRWGKYGAKRQYVYTCPECRAVVEPAAWPAWTAIDWSNLGIPIWERDKYGLPPLKPATLERIRRGLTKFRHYPPVVIPTGAWGGTHPVSEPFSTQTCLQDKTLVSAGVVAQRTDNVPAGASEQVGPVTTSGGGGHALVSSAVIPQRSDTNGEHVTGHVDPLTTRGDMSLASFVLPVCGKTKDYQRGGHVSDPTYTQQTTPKLAVASMLIKNNGDESEAKYRALPVIDPFGALTTSPTQSVASMVLAAKGHTFERGDYARARSVTEQFFTQHTSEAYAIASSQIVAMRGGGGMDNQKPVTEPTGAVTAGGMHHGLMTPALFAKFNGGPGDTSWHGVDEPFNTVTTRDTHGMVFRPWVEQFLAGADSVHVTEQLATVMTHMRHALASVEHEPADPVTEDDLLRACFRMLEPDPELRFVMAFGPHYILLGNKTQMTAGLGNAVTPPVAAWLTERCLATLR